VDGNYTKKRGRERKGLERLKGEEGEKKRRVGEKVKGKRKKGRGKEKKEYPFQIFHNRW
jgi:hypothetical protein